MRILIIDDDDDVRLIARLTLEQHPGWVVEAAKGCDEALEKGREFHPDLVLLDLNMPGTDGLDTLALLRDAPGFSQAQFVFLTAGQPGEAVRQAAVRGVLNKPFDPETFPDRIRALLDGT